MNHKNEWPIENTKETQYTQTEEQQEIILTA